MKIYAIGGLGADERVFSKLKLDFAIQIIQWETPKKGEDINSYAKALLSQIDLNDQVCLIGVSFGGMLAIALQPYVNPVLTILISSAQNKFELPLLYRLIGKLQLVRLIPSKWIKLPDVFAKWLFGAVDDKLLYAIMKDTDPLFLKWALIAITSWEEESNYSNVVKVHGTKDRLIPYSHKFVQISIEGGGHFMIVDYAIELSSVINEKVKEIS